MDYKKIIIPSVIVLILVSIGIWLFTLFTTSTINISSPQGSDIFIKQNTSDFVKIGNTNTTYKTRDKSVVIVEARSENQVTQKPITPQPNKTIDITLEFQPLVEAKEFSQGPLTNILIEGGAIYGINPQTNSLAVFTVPPNTKPPTILSTLPNLKQVLWKDSKNYNYVTIGRGTGIVRDGVSRDREFNTISGVATYNNKDFILYDNTGFYYSKDSDLTVKSKLSDTVKNSNAQVFADSNYMYTVSLVYKDVKEEGDFDPEGKETKLTLYDQSGKKVGEHTLDIKNKSSKVLTINKSNIGILTLNGLYIFNLDTKELSKKDFSFGAAEDMVMFNNKLLLLGSSGLWEYKSEQEVYSKVAKYPDELVYVPGSLSVFRNELYFSTAVSNSALLEKSGPQTTSKIYKISL